MEKFLTFILLATSQLLPLFQQGPIHRCDFIQDLQRKSEQYAMQNRNLTDPVGQWEQEEMQSAKAHESVIQKSKESEMMTSEGGVCVYCMLR